MNKQELIEKYAKFEEYVRKQGWNIEDLDSFDRGELAGESQLVSMLLNDLKQLDEPEITEEMAWEVIERANHYHIAPADVWIYKEAIQKGILPGDISKPELPVIPKFVADWIEYIKESRSWLSLYGVLRFSIRTNQEMKEWILKDNSGLFSKAWLYGYAIEPQKNLQVIVKNYDSTVFTTELPEDEAMKLIEGWK